MITGGQTLYDAYNMQTTGWKTMESTSNMVSTLQSKVNVGQYYWALGFYEMYNDDNKAVCEGYSNSTYRPYCEVTYTVPPDITVENANVTGSPVCAGGTIDVNDTGADNREILYYTVQLMALNNPVDISFFTGIDDVKVLFGKDLFYRYTTCRLATIEEAEQHRTEIINMGYPDQIFIKKVYRQAVGE